MMKYIYEEDVEELKDNILDEGCKVIYIKRACQNYYLHIICCEFSNLDALRENWQEVVHNVAESIQRKLEKLIERFNIYILFFQYEKEETLSYIIEQNKYSSRKIVISDKMPKNREELEKLINHKLFDLKIEKEPQEAFAFKIDGMPSLIEKNNTKDLEEYIMKLAEEKMHEKN